MAVSWGLKRLLASPATDLLVRISRKSQMATKQSTLTVSRKSQGSKRTRNGKQNNEHLQVWAGWLVLVTASLVLPIYLAASLLSDRHCTPQHSIVLPIGGTSHFNRFHCVVLDNHYESRDTFKIYTDGQMDA